MIPTSSRGGVPSAAILATLAQCGRAKKLRHVGRRTLRNFDLRQMADLGVDNDLRARNGRRELWALAGSINTSLSPCRINVGTLMFCSAAAVAWLKRRD
jgi:hypothetical protein